MRATVALIGVMAAASAFAATTYTWDGGAGTAHLNDAENWNPDGVPSMANGDVGTIAISETAKSFDLSGDFDIKQLSVSKSAAEEPIRAVLDLGGHTLSATTAISASWDANFKPSARDLWIKDGTLLVYKVRHGEDSSTTYTNATLALAEVASTYFANPGTKLSFIDSTLDGSGKDISMRAGATGASCTFSGTCRVDAKSIGGSGTNQTVEVKPNSDFTAGMIWFSGTSVGGKFLVCSNTTLSITYLRTCQGTSDKGAQFFTVQLERGVNLALNNVSGVYSFNARNSKIVLNDAKLSTNANGDFGYNALSSDCGVEINGDAAVFSIKEIHLGHVDNPEPCWISFRPGVTGFGGTAPVRSQQSKNITIAGNVIVKIDATEFLKGRIGSRANPTVRLPLMTASGALALDVDALAANAQIVPAGGKLVAEGKSLYAEFPLPKPGLTVIVR